MSVGLGHGHGSPEVGRQGTRSRSKVRAKMCVLHEYLQRSSHWLMDVVVGLHWDVLSCELTRPCLWRSAAEASGNLTAESSACGVRRAYAITRSVWHRSSIVGSFSTFIVLFIHTVGLPMKEVTSRLGLNGPKIYPKHISRQLLWLNDSRFFDFLPNERRLLLLYAGWAKQVGPQTHDDNSVKC